MGMSGLLIRLSAARFGTIFPPMECKLSQSLPVDMDIYARLTGHLRRVLETLGVERRQRDISPTLGELLQEAADGRELRSAP